MKKALNITLLISFLVTIMAPLTGVHVHKMATVLFLLLSIVHTIVYRKKLGVKRWLYTMNRNILTFTKCQRKIY